MSARTPEAEPLLTPAEVATMFRVDPKTVTRWAKAGKLTSIRTLGGTGATGRPRSVLCSRVYRSSVPSNIPPRERGRSRDYPARRSRRSSSSGGGLVSVGKRGSRGSF